MTMSSPDRPGAVSVDAGRAGARHLGVLSDFAVARFAVTRFAVTRFAVARFAVAFFARTVHFPLRGSRLVSLITTFKNASGASCAAVTAGRNPRR
jgi:hypothetical protein